MFAIYKRELKAYFISPIGYLFVGNFLAVSGLLFSICTLQQQESSSVSNYFRYLIYAFAILLPLLTMKSLSEERKTKSEQLLMTSPVSISGMIMGKYFASLTVFTAVLLCNSLNFLLLEKFGDPNGRLIISNLICLFFIGALFLAVGMFFSSLTEDPLVSAIGSMDAIFVMLAVNFLSDITIPWLKKIVDFISVLSRYEPFTYGILDITSIIYYVSIAAVFIFFTVRVYERRRWA
ncbi:MAG: ABC transporter permease [Clostridia bacterium]|nr:ABC transporter permease [Clostridia bacterium]